MLKKSLIVLLLLTQVCSSAFALYKPKHDGYQCGSHIVFLYGQIWKDLDDIIKTAEKIKNFDSYKNKVIKAAKDNIGSVKNARHKIMGVKNYKKRYFLKPTSAKESVENWKKEVDSISKLDANISLQYRRIRRSISRREYVLNQYGDLSAIMALEEKDKSVLKRYEEGLIALELLPVFDQLINEVNRNCNVSSSTFGVKYFKPYHDILVDLHEDVDETRYRKGKDAALAVISNFKNKIKCKR